MTKEAEDAWVELMEGTAWRIGTARLHSRLLQQRGPAEAAPCARLNVGYPDGPMAFFSYLDQWRTSGAFEGLEFRR